MRTMQQQNRENVLPWVKKVLRYFHKAIINLTQQLKLGSKVDERTKLVLLYALQKLGEFVLPPTGRCWDGLCLLFG